MKPRLLSVILGVFTLVVATSHVGRAQQNAPRTPDRTGRIVGRVIDAGTGQGISDVGVQVVGTRLGAVSGVDGRFTIPSVPAGTVTLQARRIGFQPKTVTGIMLEVGRTLEQSISLEASAAQLSATVVTAAAERGSVNEAMDAQRTATAIMSAVSSEQISRSPDGDAAQAAQRVSGVTIQRGGLVNVRGLGERYTTTQLNGTRVPSPEPEKRTVPLDLFPSNLLEAVATSKTFTPDQQGDFSGAQLEIKTREFPAVRQFTYSVTTGFSPGTTGDEILNAFRAGGEFVASASANRGMPPLLQAAGNFQGINLNQSDKNLLVSSFRNAWTPTLQTAGPNTSTSFSIGGNDPLFGQHIGYLVSGTYSLTHDRKSDQVRALANRGTTAGETVEMDRFEGETGSTGVLWGGLANFSTLLGGHTRLAFNNTYSRTADNDARREFGSFENEGIRARIDRMQYVERSVRSTQLAAEHQLGARQQLDWAVTGSGVTRDEPDRTEFVYVIEQDAPGSPDLFRWLNSGNAGAVRTFSELTEDNLEGRLNYQLDFELFGRRHFVKTGGLYRETERDADTRAYSISAPTASNAIRELEPELLFDGRFFSPADSVFNIVPLAQGGAYGARDELSAGYLMTEVALTDRVRLIGGARYERDRLVVDATSTLGQPVQAENTWTDVLPSLAMNVSLSEFQNLRISVSRTLARPEYRELVPIKSRDVLNGDDLEGNPDLQRTRIQNADVRWEWYPASGEVVSIGLFAKRFDDPIERVYRAAGASSRFVGFVNAERAENYGVELELRKGLGFLHSALDPFSMFSNVTLMRSEIDLGANRAAATNPERPMVGQAPYIVNLGVAYASQTGSTSATLLFNRVGERIETAGDLPLPDVVQRPRNVLDFSVRFPVLSAVSARFDARNLFDEPYEVMQGTVTRESWRAGRVYQMGLVWRP
ncbi:MAG TPA: TonB-dependent receptor [Gemmatimonadaceae bacterium]|nr:TonB-dependent receptor [Gemmatimonadaceae bacterium]